MVIGMIVCSTFTYPEASCILNHYGFGNGDTLILDTSYLKLSPIITKELVSMKVGETKIVRFTQKDDWRLSYAINGFTLIKKEKEKLNKFEKAYKQREEREEREEWEKFIEEWKKKMRQEESWDDEDSKVSNETPPKKEDKKEDNSRQDLVF